MICFCVIPETVKVVKALVKWTKQKNFDASVDKAALHADMWWSSSMVRCFPFEVSGLQGSVGHCLSSIGRENCNFSGAQDRYHRACLPSVVGVIASSGNRNAEQLA